MYSKWTWGIQVKSYCLYLLCEAKIELTVVKLCFEDIIERSPLKARLGEVAQECWVNSLLNLFCLHV